MKLYLSQHLGPVVVHSEYRSQWESDGSTNNRIRMLCPLAGLVPGKTSAILRSGGLTEDT